MAARPDIFNAKIITNIGFTWNFNGFSCNFNGIFNGRVGFIGFLGVRMGFQCSF